MGGRQPVHVVDFAVRGQPAVEVRAVPGGRARLDTARIAPSGSTTCPAPCRACRPVRGRRPSGRCRGCDARTRRDAEGLGVELHRRGNVGQFLDRRGRSLASGQNHGHRYGQCARSQHPGPVRAHKRHAAPPLASPRGRVALPRAPAAHCETFRRARLRAAIPARRQSPLRRHLGPAPLTKLPSARGRSGRPAPPCPPLHLAPNRPSIAAGRR